MALLDVRDLKIAFYDTTPPTEVVKGISFSLEEGETLGIVGESGSGKTQTALSILHLLKENSAVSGGEILYEDSSVAHASSQDLQRIRGKEISMIFQEPMTSLNPVLTIEEQIAEGLLIHESCTPAERHEKVLAIMHEVELPDPEKLCKKYPHQLSGGQRQRVMIAAALITEPKLLIADEPTTALDVTIQSQILKLLKKINERHHTAILFISHDLGVIRSLCDRVIVMNHGTIVESGSVDDVFFHPKEDYTRRLLDAIPNRHRCESESKSLQQLNGRQALTKKLLRRRKRRNNPWKKSVRTTFWKSAIFLPPIRRESKEKRCFMISLSSFMKMKFSVSSERADAENRHSPK